MPRVIVKCRYYTPQNSARDVGGMLRYIGTREGVDRFGVEWRNEKATVAQDELIERFTATIAQSTRLPEYETYQSARSKGSASEFISAVLENYPELLSDKTYLDYIATRPRTEQYAGTHGLFSEEGIDIDLNKEAELVRNHTGNVFSIIVSLKREDAERLEYNSADRWCNLARNKIQEVAQEYGIPLTHLKWFGAFHNESHHPHIHLMLYSTDGCHPGHINKQGVANLRRVFGTAIFREELRQVYDDQTKVRNKLNATAFDEIEELADKVRTGLAQNGDFVLKFIALAKRLQTVSGKKVYGYLPEAVRKQVRELVDVLEQDEDIARMYELWYQAKCAVYHTYTDNDPVKKPLSQEEAFKPIRNALIKEANALGTQLSAMESEELSGEEDVSFYLSRLSSHANSTKSPPSQTQSPSISKPAATRAGVVATSVARFGNSLSRTFRNKFYDQVDKSPMSVDSRLQREIEAKKRGQNLSM